MRRLAAILLLALPAFAQPAPAKQKPPQTTPPVQAGESPEPPDNLAEQEELRRSLAESGNSPIEFIRALERHLEKYPKTAERPELERAIVKAAIEQQDSARILEYGERVLARQQDDIQILERVTRVLLAGDVAENARKALDYANRLEELLRGVEGSKKLQDVRAQARMRDELDRAISRTVVLQARALGNLGKLDEAVAHAKKSYDASPNAESAREIGRWLDRSGQPLEAVRHYADAFTIVDARNTDADRTLDRKRMGELYVKAKGSEAGLGDLILEAYDRTAALVQARSARLQKLDPNSQVTDPMDYTISGLGGEKLNLASLRGKVLVLDFWATWCAPCRAQYPLYEEVKKRFAGKPEVVFLAINTDEDRSVVKPFLEQNKWNKNVYFEDGLSGVLKIASIPTTIVVNRKGEIVSRMNGFLPDRFVEMLTERIRESLD
jgi:thiol-disulfide isomerase/thioredoxin